jgi:hypothetical protein
MHWTWFSVIRLSRALRRLTGPQVSIAVFDSRTRRICKPHPTFRKFYDESVSWSLGFYTCTTLQQLLSILISLGHVLELKSYAAVKTWPSGYLPFSRTVCNGRGAGVCSTKYGTWRSTRHGYANGPFRASGRTTFDTRSELCIGSCLSPD